MRLESVRVRNIGPFPDFTLDLAGTAGRVIAITGENGAGKTTILEVGMPGAMYRDTPTRGSLVKLATARDSMVEAKLVNGSRWTLKHVLDAVSGKSEAVVLDEAGASVLPDSKVKSFDAWAAKTLPAPEVLFSCLFTPQNTRGFLAAKPAERKAILLRILGVERLEHQAEIAREREREARGNLTTLEARIADQKRALGIDQAAIELWNKMHPEKSFGTIAVAEGVLAQANVLALASDNALTVARETLAKAEAEARRADELEKEAKQNRARRTEIEGSLARERVALEDKERRLANNRRVLEEADAIRKAVAEVERLNAEIATSQTAVQTNDAEASAKAARARELVGELRDVDVQIERSEMVFADRKTIEDAERSIPGLEVAVSEAAGAVGVAEDALEDLRGKHVDGADERIKGLRTGLVKVTEIKEFRGLSKIWEVAANTLEADDKAVALAAELPEQVAQAQAAVKAARARKDEADKKLAAARTTASRRSALNAAQQNHDAATARRAGLEKALDAVSVAELNASSEALKHRKQVATAREALVELSELAAKAGPLAGAEVRITELEPAIEAAKSAVEKLEADLAAVPPDGDLPAAPALAPLDRAARDAEAAARKAHQAVAVAEKALEAAREGAGRLAELEGERKAVESDLADWTRLAGDLGRDGLQAAEIDAAGPELTEMVNDLLHRTHGPRFSVRVETQKLSADGKRMLEGCEVVVLDTEKGREAPGETFSGGEQTFVAEALSLGLSMLACKRAGIERPTLVRDESGAALSAGMRPFYVPMLRRAADIIGADKIVFVSHFDDVVEMADARIEVG